jgi:hypothetical protein
MFDGSLEYKIVLFCQIEFSKLVNFLYQDMLKYIQFEFLDVIDYTLSNFEENILSSYSDYTIKAYDEFDTLRPPSDDNYNVFDTFVPSELTFVNIIQLYSADGFDPETIVMATPDGRTDVVVYRNFAIENSMAQKLKNYFNLKFVSISNNKFKKYVFNNEVHSINFNQLFPNNTNVFNFISLCTKATSFIVSNDDFGRLIYTLQTKRINGEIVLNNRIKVLFHLESHANRDEFLIANPFFVGHPPSWKFGYYDLSSPPPPPPQRTGWILLERSATLYDGNASISASYGDENVGNFSRLLEFDEERDDYSQANIFTPFEGVPSYLFRQLHFANESDKTDPLRSNKPDDGGDGYWQWTQTSHPNKVAAGTVSNALNKSYDAQLNAFLGTYILVALLGLCIPPIDVYNENVRYITDEQKDRWGGTQHNTYALGVQFYGVGRKQSHMTELYVWSGPKPATLPIGIQI